MQIPSLKLGEQREGARLTETCKGGPPKAEVETFGGQVLTAHLVLM